MNYNKGQVQIGMIAAIISAIAGIGAPFIWAGDIKATNKVQDREIEHLSEQQTRDRKEFLEALNKLDSGYNSISDFRLSILHHLRDIYRVQETRHSAFDSGGKDKNTQIFTRTHRM